MTTLVIVGGALAGLRAAERARESGFDGEVVVIGEETVAPYDRPALSKSYLTSNVGLVEYRSLEALRDEVQITLRLGERAVGLNTETRVVRTDTGDVAYDKLIIATGASPRQLAFGHDLDGVHTLRTAVDAERLRSELRPGARVVVIGGGFIGSEIASSAGELGAEVTIIEGAEIPLVRAVGHELGAALAGLHARHGVELRTSTQLLGFLGEGRVTGVKLDGGEELPADIVIVGVGATPATQWLRDSGVELSSDGGVICDEYLATSAPHVYAAGDVVSWPNAALGLTARLENWTSASDQGGRAAINALFPERAEPFVTVPYFWSDWYGHRIQFVGSAAADEVRFVLGAPDGASFVALFRSGDRLIGAGTLNEPRKVMKYRRHIALHGSWSEALALFPNPSPEDINVSA